MYNVITLSSLIASPATTPLTNASGDAMERPDSAKPLIRQDDSPNVDRSSSSPTIDTSLKTAVSLAPHDSVSLKEQETVRRPALTAKPLASVLVPALAWIWLAGAAAAIAFILRANIRFARELRRHAIAYDDPAILRLVEDCKRQLRIRRRKIGIYKTDCIASPALTGIVRPKLLLPSAIVPELDEQQLRHIVLHELSHLKRNDLFVNAFMQALLAFHWFNPLLYYAYFRMREDQELACDSLALSRLRIDEGRDYALTLIRLLEGWSNKPARLVHSAYLLGNRVFWKRRMNMIQARKPNSLRRTLLGITALVLIAGCSLTGGESDEPAGGTRGPSMEDVSLATVKLASAEAGEIEQVKLGTATKPDMELLASVEGANLYGTGIVTEDDAFLQPIKRYDELTVEMNGRSYTYPWQIIINEEAKPQIRLYRGDVNRDGKDELIVIITSNSMWHKTEGRTYRDSLHIIRPEDGSEVKVADPATAAMLQYKPSIIVKDGNVDVYLDTDIAKLHRSLGETNFGSNKMEENLIIGRYLQYEYSNGKLWAGVTGSLTDNQGGNILFMSFVVRYAPDLSISSVSINDLDGWEVVDSD